MKIRVLGTRGEIKVSDNKHIYHSGVLIDNLVMLDLGEKDFLKYHPKIVFITHLHPDHAYFARHHFKAPNLTIFAPELYGEDQRVKIINKLIKFDFYKITPIPTIHSKKVKSQAYLIEKNLKRVLYTGDMIWIKKEYWPILINLDLVITEGSFINIGGRIRRDNEKNVFGHTDIPNLIKFFSPFTQKILFIHFGSWFFDDTKRSIHRIEALTQEGLDLMIGYDGMELDV
jgi:ribonuclease BN (tRNA processing enzyme)